MRASLTVAGVAVAVATAMAVPMSPSYALQAPSCFGQTATATPNTNYAGTPGDDVIVVQAGSVALTIHGGGGNDRICDSNGEGNVLYGDAGSDRVQGSLDDTASGGSGDDVLKGGTLFSYADSPNPVTVDFVQATATGWGTDTLVNVTHVEGSGFNDVFKGSSAAEVISGLVGNDRLIGGGGGDWLDGGVGNDTLSGGSGGDQLQLSVGNDTVSGGTNPTIPRDIVTLPSDWPVSAYIDLGSGVAQSGTTLASKLTGVENAVGGPAGDVIYGTDGPNYIDGGAGNDNLYGLGGDDTLLGGDGTDYGDCGSGADGYSPDLEQRFQCENEVA